MAIIYGVDTSKPVSPKDVRDAVVECFVQAHQEQLEELEEYGGQGQGDENMEEIKRINVRQMMRNLFEQSGDDFDNPDKDAIIRSVEGLKAFAANFRNQETVGKHYREIRILTSLLA